jgi:hypothetical protein
MTVPQSIEVHLPFGLTDERLNLRAICDDKSPVTLSVPSDFDKQLGDSKGTFGEVFAIQVALTLARSGVPLLVSWDANSVTTLMESAATQPLVAVLVSMQGARHQTKEGMADSDLHKLLLASRKSIVGYRLKADFFSDRQIALCADSRGYSYPPDLYEAETHLRSREDYEGLIQDVLVGQLANLSEAADSYRFSSALGVIVAELFENTHIHGRFDLAGAMLKPDAMRGLMLKRIKFDLPVTVTVDGRTKGTTQVQECLEVSVFDTGMGYMQSFTHQPLTDQTDLGLEWKVFHNCLKRHHDQDLGDTRAAHRGMGLAEVLRALQELEGRIEIRTGRLFAQRTFLPGELQALMAPYSSRWAHRRQPIPKMLDYQKKYVGVPTQHDRVFGTAVRVIIPLK